MSGTIFISGDTTKLTAQGGIGAAGIGAGRGEWPFPNGDMKGEITIECGDNSDLKIIGGSGGAGIGAGFQGNMQGKAYINGGKIKITSGYEAAGIGGGREGTFDEGGEGGTVYIGGGDITIDLLSNKPQLADSHAIGRGALDEKTGTLYISKDNNKTGKCMRVDYRLFRVKEGWSGTAKAGSRTDKCHAENDVHITVCDHTDYKGNSGITYTIVDNSKHIRKCKFCGLEETEQHYSSDCECGYSNPNKTVKLSSLDGITTATVASGKKFTLPYNEGDIVTGNTVPVSYYEVTGWKDRDGKSYEAGSDVTITEDMEFTLQHEKRYIVECSKNTNGKIKADADFAKQGETVSFSAEPEPDYTISKVLYTYITGYDPDKAEDIYADPVEIAADAEGKYQLTMPVLSEPANGIIVSAEHRFG